MSETHHFKSITQLVRELGLPAPQHPLVALVDYGCVPKEMLALGRKTILDFYKISFKYAFKGKTKYGPGYYDFQEGGLAFLKPKQIVVSPEDAESYVGLSLYFHPDFIRNFHLGASINRYGFFSYDVSEALFLSTKEKSIIGSLFASIGDELSHNIDQFSQEIVVSQIEVLLNYSKRFYNRQFITRKVSENGLLDKLDKMLHDYFDTGKALVDGVPAVADISAELKLSQRYLSDMLKSWTGLNTQQYVQNILIDKAKERLSNTNSPVSEIAYDLGFEHPQSFSKLFKAKTLQSPLEFRASFNH